MAATSGVKHAARLTDQKIHASREATQEILSPLHLFTGVLAPGTNRAVLLRKNGDDSQTFTIDTSDRKAISLLLRLDYGNIGHGHNQYKLSLRRGNQLLAIRLFALDSFYTILPFGDLTLYTSEKADAAAPDTGDIYVDVGQTAPSYLVKYTNADLALEERYALQSPFTYNTAAGLLYEYRDLHSAGGETPTPESKLQYGDLYINGALIARDIPLFYPAT